MINATGLWLNKTKDGKSYMSGTMGGVKVLIFKNEKKTEDKHPDYQLCFAENKPKDKAVPKEDDPAGAGNPFGDNEIPF